ncbi:3-hydroxyacyl-CoA dehydrogenase family protein [Roseobacter sp. A03A-229]
MTDAEVAARLTDGLYAAADALLFQATTPWELDAAMEDFGFATGLCADQDMVGLDTVVARCVDGGRAPTAALARMVADGRLGRRVGVGWYRYPGGGGRVVDPLVEDLLREEAWFAGLTRTEVSDDVLITRLLIGLASAAGQLLKQGVPPACVDRVSQRDLGFPAAKGSLVSHLRDIGPGALEHAMGEVSPDEIRRFFDQL